MAPRRPNKSRSTRPSQNDVDELLTKLEPLVQHIEALKRQAAELGLFTNDREFLHCPRCGLREDVAFGGQLMTYFESDCSRDTGLRFTETGVPRRFSCPSCGEVVIEPEVPISDYD